MGGTKKMGFEKRSVVMKHAYRRQTSKENKNKQVTYPKEDITFFNS
jgi:hypothetical protein